MSSLVRRFTRNSRGELEEVGQTDTTGPDTSPGFHDSTGTYEVTKNGQTLRYRRPRRYVPEIAPPAPSPQYRADPGYVAHVDYPADTRQRAIANHRAWQERHGQATGQMTAWLAGEGLLGDDAKAAFAANQRTATAKAEARQKVDDAKTAANQAAEQLHQAVTDHLNGKGALPDGATVTAATTAVEGYELVAAQVDEAAAAAFQRWGRCLNRADWPAALRQAEQLRGDEAAQATAWLRAKVRPPVGPTADPLAWI